MPQNVSLLKDKENTSLLFYTTTKKHKLYRFTRDFLQSVRICNFISLTIISGKQLLPAPLQTPLHKSYTKTKAWMATIGKTNSTTNAVSFLKISHFRCWRERYGIAASCDTKPRVNFPWKSISCAGWQDWLF